MNLPAPKHTTTVGETGIASGRSASPEKARNVVPPYGARMNHVPKDIVDFGDGGAFPEINRLQYPLNMGRAGAKGKSVVSLEVDNKGEVMYNSIIIQIDN